MARAAAPVRRHSAAQRAVASVAALAAVALLALVGRGVVSQPRGSAIVQDAGTAGRLYQLAKESSDAADFVARLRQAGLMEGAGQQAGGGGGGVAQPDGGGGKPSSSGSGGSATGTAKQLPVPQLSRELAHAHARGGTIIVTWANAHFSDFVLNWVHHVRSHGIDNYLVGAMDRETGQALAGRGLPVFAMYDEAAGQADTGLGTADFGWGSPTFHKMGRQKVDLSRTFTGYGLDLCLCDVDTVWINDPTEYFERFPAAAILASSDNLLPTNPIGDSGLEQPPAIHSAMNIGLLFFRHGAPTTAFIDAWQQRLDADDKAWDQNVFNWVGHEGLMPLQSPEDNPRLVWAANHSLLIGVLPVAAFASGHTFFVQRLFEYQQVQPYVVHTTFQFGGSSGKRHRLREAMLWVDPPAYYAEGRFLSVDLVYPTSPPDFQLQDQFMMEGQRFKTDWTEAAMADFHLQAMGKQLRQLRTALGLAVALNRTLIMPKLVSWCDRYWGPTEFCQVPGAFKTRLPFVAPMDHVLEPFHFTDLPNQMPVVDFREFSFLANERTPARLKETRVVVAPDAAAKQGKMREEGGARVLRIPRRQSDKQLRALLEPHAGTQLLHFSSLEGAFGGFEEQVAAARFQARLLHMAGFWCCKKVKEGEDGGVGYAPSLDGSAQHPHFDG